MARLIALEAEPWCLAAGISYTQPWMNLPDIGASVAITADTAVAGAVESAEAAAADLANGLFTVSFRCPAFVGVYCSPPPDASPPTVLPAGWACTISMGRRGDGETGRLLPAGWAMYPIVSAPC